MSLGAPTPPLVVTAEHLSQFDSLGYFVLERAIDPPSLALLQQIADDVEAARSAEHHSSGDGPAVGDAEGPQLMNNSGGRTFAFGIEKERPEMYSAILGDWAATTLAALTPRSSLFHTEFVLKAGGRADAQTRFGWHQDGSYTTTPGGGEPSAPHISVWCALDDMSEENGALRVMPFTDNPAYNADGVAGVTSTAAPRDGASHQPMYQHTSASIDSDNGVNLTGDIVGYSGSDPGVILTVPAGSVIVFSSLALHGSGDNLSLLPRRALNLAFTQQHEQAAQEHNADAVPFLENGKVVPSAKRLRNSVSFTPDPLATEYRESGFVVARQVFTKDELAEIVSAVAERTTEARRWYAAEAGAEIRGDAATGDSLRVVGEGLDGGEVSNTGDKMFERPGSNKGDAPQVRALFRLHDEQDTAVGFFRGLLEHPRMVALARRLLGGQEVVPSMVQFIDKAPHTTYAFPYHQDNAYGQFWTPVEYVTAALALDAQDGQSGSITCLRGSHRLPVLPHEASGVLGASLALTPSSLDLSQFQEVSLKLQPGDVSFHHTNLIHRTGPNSTAFYRRNLGFGYRSQRARQTAAPHRPYAADETNKSRKLMAGTEKNPTAAASSRL